VAEYTLKELLANREELVQRGIDLDASIGESPDAEQRKAMRTIETELRELDVEVDDVQSTEQAREGIRSARQELETARQASTRQPIYEEPQVEETDKKVEQETPGESFVRSESYANWLAKFPNSAPMGDFRSDPVKIESMARLMGMRMGGEGMRALLTSNDASAGQLVYSLRRGLLEPGLVRPLTVRDVVTVLPVSTDTIEYVKENSRVSAAAPVAEATALTGTSGTKPEGGLTFTVVTDTVKTLAEWIPATKRILQDAPLLRAYIDEYLSYDLALELEDQMITGNNTGENFNGILNQAGLTQGAVANENNFDLVRRAKTKVRLVARTNPNAVLMNPNDAQNMDIAKSGSASAPYQYWGAGPFGQGNGPQSLWGIPVVESEAVNADTAVVGDFTRAVLYDRESTTISVGTANDDFIRNIVRILAEMRAGFGVIRPSSFCVVTLA